MHEVAEISNFGDHDIIPSAFKANPSDPDTLSFAEAMADVENIDLWMKAADAESKSLKKNGMWVEVQINDARTRILPGTWWVFKRKRTPDGTISKYKAWHCVRGNLQDINDQETFAPVVVWSTVRLFLVLSITLQWETCTIDFSNAFVQAKLTEPVWIHLPRGFRSEKGPSTCLRLAKSLYGLNVAMKCTPLTNARSGMRTRFEEAVSRGTASVAGSSCICATPVQWFEEGFGPQYRISRVIFASDVLPRKQGQHDDLSVFFLMDVILHRQLRTRIRGGAQPLFSDEIVWARADDERDLEDESDFKYRTLIAYLPGAGVFYCARDFYGARDSPWAEEGVKGAHIPRCDSWLRLNNDDRGRTCPLGHSGYVKRWHEACKTFEANHFSIWKVLTSGMPKRQVRRVYLAKQVFDYSSSGPVMAPDVVVDGQHLVHSTHADRAKAYTTRLASSCYAKPWGRKSGPTKDCQGICITLLPSRHSFRLPYDRWC